MSPIHSINFCPICGGGLCGIRICGLESPDSTAPHGLVICDECEAIWLDPDVTTVHQYPNIEDARCPVCNDPLWGQQSRWANADDVQSLGWDYAINPDLDATPDEGIT